MQTSIAVAEFTVKPSNNKKYGDEFVYVKKDCINRKLIQFSAKV